MKQCGIKASTPRRPRRPPPPQLYLLAGGLLNALRIPEKYFQPADPAAPGRMDLWLNGHQLMHILAVVAGLHLHWGAAADYRTMQALRSGGLQC